MGLSGDKMIRSMNEAGSHDAIHVLLTPKYKQYVFHIVIWIQKLYVMMMKSENLPPKINKTHIWLLDTAAIVRML